jgi:NhaA family Na+:H+ antiporter
VLTASVIAALLAGVAIRARNRHYSEVYARESEDEDGDGIPDVYQSPDDR